MVIEDFTFTVRHSKLVSKIYSLTLNFQFSIPFTERKEQIPFSMAIGNVELVQEYCPNICAREQKVGNKTKKDRKILRK